MSKNILVLAYALSPTRGSEYAVAWNYIKNMSLNNRLTVLYGASGEHLGDMAEMQEYCRQNVVPNVTFIPVAPNEKINKLNSLNRSNVLVYTFYFAYSEWQKLAYLKAQELVAKESFDLVHYLGPIGYREPGYLWQLDIPYMWGPIGGMNNVSYKFLPVLIHAGLLGHTFRSVANYLQFRFSSRVKRAIKRSDLIISATTAGQCKLKKIHRKETLYTPENCLMNEAALNYDKFVTPAPLNIIFAGRIDARKALRILIESLAKVKDKSSFVLHVVGDGPLEPDMKRLAEQRGLDGAIVWHGRVSRDKVLQLFNSAHLHCITSLSEANTTVIWEAMEDGVPTLSIDHCGMHDTICEECGFKIAIKSYRQVTTDIAQTIEHCINNPDTLRLKAEGVLKCASKYYWSERKEFFEQCYDQSIHNFQTKRVDE